MNITDLNSFINSQSISNVSITPAINELASFFDSTGINAFVTNAESITYSIMNAQPMLKRAGNALLTQADYAAANASVPVAKYQTIPINNYIFRVDLTGYDANAPLAERWAVGQEVPEYNAIMKQIDMSVSNTGLMEVTDALKLKATYTSQGVLTANVIDGNAGNIEFDTTVATTAKTKIKAILDSIALKFPAEMKYGGVYEGIVTAFVSSSDFAKMKNSLNAAYQYNSTGGFANNQPTMDLTQAGATVDGMRRTFKYVNQVITYGNIAIKPMMNLANDTVIVTVQDASAGRKVMTGQMDVNVSSNLVIAMRGGFVQTTGMKTALASDSKSLIADVPYSWGTGIHLARDPYTPQILLGSVKMGFTVVIKDPSKIFAYLP